MFSIEYSKITEGFQPLYRIVSSIEQRVEAPDTQWNYIVFAADPYANIGFKIPNREFERSMDAEEKTKFKTFWDTDKKIFTVSIRNGIKLTPLVTIDLQGLGNSKWKQPAGQPRSPRVNKVI